ncbi:shikimate dehydrogenase family protein [Bordetella sp. 2513F-2]
MSEITGRTGLYCILADPISQVRTPQRVNRLLRERGSDGVMVPVHVPPAHLADAVRALRHVRNFKGMVVTVPHKMAMVSLCDALEGDAAEIGAVNVVRREPDGRLVGGMLDGLGFRRGLQSLGAELAGASVYLAGAGGAAHAIAFAMAGAGIATLTIANRSRDRIDALAGRLRMRYPDLSVRAGTRDPSGHDVVINATSLGMDAADPLPLDASRLQAQQWVADIIMDPAETALLAQARERGCRLYGGLGMLEAQIADMVAFFDATVPFAPRGSGQ